MQNENPSTGVTQSKIGITNTNSKDEYGSRLKSDHSITSLPPLEPQRTLKNRAITTEMLDVEIKKTHPDEYDDKE